MKFFNLRPERIYCFPNKFGFIGFGLFVMALITGATYSNNLVFMMSFLLLSLGLIAILQTARNIRATKIAHVRIKPNFAGESSEISVTLKNPSNEIKLSTQIEYRWAGHKHKIEFAEILPHDLQTLHGPFQLFEKRGIYSLKKMNISTTYPYALFNAWKIEKRAEEVVIYPKPVGIDLPLEKSQASGDEYSGHKEYETGDSINRLDWKAYSRTQKLYVKEFNDSNQIKTRICWDDAQQAQTEEKLSQLSLWILQADKKNYSYSLNIPGFKSDYGSGPDHYEKCMTALARV